MKLAPKPATAFSIIHLSPTQGRPGLRFARGGHRWPFPAHFLGQKQPPGQVRPRTGDKCFQNVSKNRVGIGSERGRNQRFTVDSAR